MVIYIKFNAESKYVKEFTTALEAKEYLNEFGKTAEKAERFNILFAAEPIADKSFVGRTFLTFEKDQIEEACAKINEVVTNPESLKTFSKIGNEEEKDTSPAPESDGTEEESEPGSDENKEDLDDDEGES